jgi:hypothetical protein
MIELRCVRPTRYRSDARGACEIRSRNYAHRDLHLGQIHDGATSGMVCSFWLASSMKSRASAPSSIPATGPASRIVHIGAGRAGTHACAIARARRELMQRGPRRRTPVAATAMSNFIRLKFSYGSKLGRQAPGLPRRSGSDYRYASEPAGLERWPSGLRHLESRPHLSRLEPSSADLSIIPALWRPCRPFMPRYIAWRDV